MKALKIRNSEADDWHAGGEHRFAKRLGSGVAVLMGEIQLGRVVLGRNDCQPTKVRAVWRVVAKLEPQFLSVEGPRLVLVGDIERYDIYFHDLSSAERNRRGYIHTGYAQWGGPRPEIGGRRRIRLAGLRPSGMLRIHRAPSPDWRRLDCAHPLNLSPRGPDPTPV